MDLPWGPIAEPRVETPRILVHFDVPGNVASSMFPGRINGAVDELILQCREERFRHRIIVTDPGPPNRLPDIVTGQDRGELRGRWPDTPTSVNPKLSEQPPNMTSTATQVQQRAGYPQSRGRWRDNGNDRCKQPESVARRPSPDQLAWARLRRDRTAVISGAVLFVFLLVALAPPLIERAYGVSIGV